ncbi:MAG: MTAP family purine nucleoside phosphorylase [Candidatus Nanoarchaeia archaeon]|jgi:5'-methylthioadenosine phosphorylase
MKLGLIGGSGLDDPQLISNCKELTVKTIHGEPSSTITNGLIGNVEVFILARHGKQHQYSPTQVNNKANIQALKDLGCTHIIATTAVGSLREEIMRGDFVIISDFIDLTRRRDNTFFNDFSQGANHTPMTNPFNKELRQKAIQSCKETGLRCHDKGVVITIEGPRFSTRAESNLFRQWGADVINMSIAPEAILAQEAGINYCAIAMSTDYDCWKNDEEPVNWDSILKIFNDNASKMKKLLLTIIKSLN